ncbi:MAG: VWA domain-containing protein, partial [Pyrinomonadaceae bacterium]
FSSVDKPFSVALILDMSNSTRYKVSEIQDAALTFVNQLRPEDQVMVVAFDDQIRVPTIFTNDRKKVQEAILSTRTGGNTRLYDAVDLVMNKYLTKMEGRKAMVLFTDGVDTSSKQADYESTMRDAEELDALIYPVQYDTYDDINYGGGTGSIATTFPSLPSILGIPNSRNRGPGSSSGEYSKADNYLRGLADVTGAREYKVNHFTDLDRAFQLVAEELRRQYSLGYYPQSSASIGERRRIRVRAKQGGLVVKARTSYVYAPRQAMNKLPDSGQKPEESKNPELKTRQLKTDAQGNIIIP